MKSDSLTIEVIAPASHPIGEVYLKGIKKLEESGFNVLFDPQILDPKAQIFHANDDQKRFAFLKRALNNSKADILWSVRGGYGSQRLLPELLKMKKPKKPKLLIGYSDISTLHLFLNQVWKWPTLHGALVDSIARESLAESDKKILIDILQGRIQKWEMGNLIALNKSAQKKTKVKGCLVGGNLTVVNHTMGTRLQPKVKDAIWVFEDIGERGYKVDRTLMQMEQAGIFKTAKAIIFGDFNESDEPGDSKVSHVGLALNRFAEKIKLPVFSGGAFGHAGRNLPLVLGQKCELQMGPEGCLYQSFKLKEKGIS